MLDGFAIQIALSDPVVDGELAFATSMRFCCRPARLRMVPQAPAGVTWPAPFDPLSWRRLIRGARESRTTRA